MSASGRTRLMLAMIGLFLAVGLVLLTVFNSTKPRIVIVHSLSDASSWTAAVNRGIRAALSGNRMPISVSLDYLDLDRLSQEADRGALAASVRGRIESIRPDVLIVVDDESSDLIGRHYARGKSATAVVYTGVLADPRSYGYVDPAVAIGIRETLPLEAIATVIRHTHAARPVRIAVVGAATLTGLAEMQQVRDHDWGSLEIVASESVPHFEAWKRFVEGPARSADVLIALTMDNLARDASDLRSMPEDQVATWTERYAVPLTIGVRESYVRSGGALAVSAPPLEYGRVAVELALKRLTDRRFALEGGSMTLNSYDVSLRLSALAQRGVSLPAIYGEAARGAGLLYR